MSALRIAFPSSVLIIFYLKLITMQEHCIIIISSVFCRSGLLSVDVSCTLQEGLAN